MKKRLIRKWAKASGCLSAYGVYASKRMKQFTQALDILLNQVMEGSQTLTETLLTTQGDVWHTQNENILTDDLFRQPVDWSDTYYDVILKDGTTAQARTTLAETGGMETYPHCELVGEAYEKYTIDDIVKWKLLKKQ